MPPYDRSDVSEENVLPWKARLDELRKLGPKDAPALVRGSPSDETQVDFIGEEETITVSDGETTMPLYRPETAGDFGVVLDPSGEARVEYTVSTIADVTGGKARWVHWEAGNVTQTTSSYSSSPVTAIRIVSVSGEATADIQMEKL